MKRSSRWALGLTIIGLLALIGWRASSNLQHEKQAQASTAQPLELPIQIAAHEVLSVQPQDLALSIPLNGVIQAVNSAVVKAYVAGELSGLSVREGDHVKKGQQLARIEAAEAQARWRQTLQQADAAKAQLAIAQRNQDNNAALVQKGFISTTALLTSQANLDAARANLAAAQAAADATHKAVTDAIISSPMNGLVAHRFVQNGERVGVEARIVEIVDPTELEIMAQLAPVDSVQVQVGQIAELQIPGMPLGTQPINAKVVRINPSAQTDSRTVATYLRIQDSGESHQSKNTARPLQLRPGLFLQGSIITGNTRQLAVPLNAVRTDKPQPYVQVLKNISESSLTTSQSQGQVLHKALKVTHQPVEIGRHASLNDSTWVQILKGLNPGDQILAGSTGALREGTLVELSAHPESAGPAPARSQ